MVRKLQPIGWNRNISTKGDKQLRNVVSPSNKLMYLESFYYVGSWSGFYWNIDGNGQLVTQSCHDGSRNLLYADMHSKRVKSVEFLHFSVGGALGGWEESKKIWWPDY